MSTTVTGLSKASADSAEMFGKHFVCLMVSYSHLDEAASPLGREQLAVFSGITMCFLDEWFNATARHRP